jgi:D-glycero-D-manno-heptose 1,7-bisphosphate phosphatase
MKVVFLDRDGVINKYPGDTKYVTHRREFKLIPGSIEGIKKLHQKGFKIFVVSNQAGVSKGLYSAKELERMTNEMVKAVKKGGAHLDGVYYCTHLEQDNCQCRKPKPGMLQTIVEEFDLHDAQTFFVGDSFIDMKTARTFGAKAVLVLSGKEKISNRRNWEFEPDFVFDNLLIAAHYLCEHYG